MSEFTAGYVVGFLSCFILIGFVFASAVRWMLFRSTRDLAAEEDATGYGSL
jgi:hypothetical protein